MPRFMAFPVRRYQTDPQAVRTALRLLSAGAGVAVYIEGERSWDGAMQAPRPGTVRLVLKAGVPVIPCGIAGAYEAWPRWSSRPQFLPVRINFGAALTFPQIDDRRAREALVPLAADRIMTELARLSGAAAVRTGG
jgi:1-acyl-sn-glycerol-3-phosphate acyltransferase